MRQKTQIYQTLRAGEIGRGEIGSWRVDSHRAAQMREKSPTNEPSNETKEPHKWAPQMRQKNPTNETKEPYVY